MHRYRSIAQVQAAVESSILDGNLDLALVLVHDFVATIISEPLCTSHVFGSETLDRLCLQIGRASLAKTRMNFPLLSPVAGARTCAYVVSKLQKSGGHTRLILDFIHARPDLSHLVLSTEIDGKSDMGFLQEAFSKQGAVSMEIAPGKGLADRLSWLQQRLVTISPERTYLFNHHQDCVAVAAITPDIGLEGYFYHHGDHHLCLGVHQPHLKHIDPHPMGYYNCRGCLGIDNIYLPLTVADKGCRPSMPFLSKDRLTTCTAAKSNKVEIPYYVSYVEVIPRLLKATGGKHIHIGKLTPWALFKLRRSLRQHGIDRSQFVYIPWVPSVWKALQSHSVDLYIASFPYGGGLTLIEAMGAGIPVAIHRHMTSPILSGIDLAYPGAFSWRDPKDLIDYCAFVTNDQLTRDSLAGREHYLRFHTDRSLVDFVNDPSSQGSVCARQSSEFSPAADEWALWMNNRLSLFNLLYRTVYRWLKRIRARLGAYR